MNRHTVIKKLQNYIIKQPRSQGFLPFLKILNVERDEALGSMLIIKNIIYIYSLICANDNACYGFVTWIKGLYFDQWFT